KSRERLGNGPFLDRRIEPASFEFLGRVPREGMGPQHLLEEDRGRLADGEELLTPPPGLCLLAPFGVRARLDDLDPLALGDVANRIDEGETVEFPHELDRVA